MNYQLWEGVVERANHDRGAKDLLVRLLLEQDQAKQILREKGYGCLGTPWLETVEEVPDLATRKVLG